MLTFDVLIPCRKRYLNGPLWAYKSGHVTRGAACSARSASNTASSLGTTFNPVAYLVVSLDDFSCAGKNLAAGFAAAGLINGSTGGSLRL